MNSQILPQSRSFCAAVMLLAAGAGRLGAEPIEPSRCADYPARVASTEPREFAGVCVAVRDTASFLQAIGLEIPAELFIVTASNWPAMDQEHALAEYDCRTHAVRIVSLKRTLSTEDTGLSVLGVPMTPALWRSCLVHEIVHAAIHQRRTCSLRNLVMTEYIAAVAQLQSLPEQERAGILARHDGITGFDNPDQITEIYYALDPGRFAVNAYLHYSKPGNGPKFIRELLESVSKPPG